MYKITIQQSHPAKQYIPPLAKIKQWVTAALCHRIRKGELTICLVSKQQIKKLNKTYRYKDKSTNVLSFKADLPEGVKLDTPLLGDIIICPDIVNQEARIQNKTNIAHWAHIVIHGSLHILGYDHVKNKDAIVMETKEIRLLKRLGFNNPYNKGVL